MKERSLGFIVNFTVRIIVGAVMIFGINECLAANDIVSGVGINLFSLGTAGFFGVPGLVLLYGIGLY